MRKVNAGVRMLSAGTHHLQFRLEWSIPPSPEWFDHYLDREWYWDLVGNPLWVERGCFSSLAIPSGGRVLELCCGDGFNASHFYAIRASTVLAVDFDQGVINHARRRNRRSNVTFDVMDIRYGMPAGPFDAVIWDAAIEHFTPSEIAGIMGDIKKVLAPGMVLAGYTIVERPEGKQLSHHEYEFASKEDLLRFLAPHFPHVKIFETIYPDRHNLYFYASDGTLPFDLSWEPQTTK